MARSAVAAAVAVAVTVLLAHAQYVERVNLRIGTGGGGFGIAHNLPGPQYPFAPMRLSPDTALDAIWIRFNHHGGYYDRDTHIRAFSHTHYVGCGGSDWGNFGVMALDKPLTNALVTNYGYRSEFDADAQVLYPGYYSVPLPTHSVRAELTVAGNYTGLHRYTFDADAAGAPKTILIDVCHALDNGDDFCDVASAAMDLPGNRLTATIKLKGGGTGRGGRGYTDVFFCGQFAEGSENPAAQSGHGTWKSNVVYPNTTSVSKVPGEAPSLGMYVEFAPTVMAVNMQVAISFISVELACANLATELRGRTTFEQCRADTVAMWNEQLSILETVELRPDQDEDDAVELYTALYRSLQSPTIYTETNGEYVAFDGSIRRSAPGATRYSDLSLWDTFRTQHPLLVLLRPKEALGCVQSLVEMSQEGTDLPRWALASHDTSSMLGDSPNSVIVDYLRKVGPEGWNQTAAYEKMRIKAFESRPNSGRANVDEFNRLGYISVESCQRCSSHNLHYYYDDYTISLLAAYLGREDDANLFYQRSLNYTRIFDPATLFMQPRRLDGTFLNVPPENQFISNEYWVEGNTNHWTFFVQHDPAGLIALFPSVQVFVERLNAVFVAYTEAGPLQAANILPNVGYWGGTPVSCRATGALAKSP